MLQEERVPHPFQKAKGSLKIDTFPTKLITYECITNTQQKSIVHRENFKKLIVKKIENARSTCILCFNYAPLVDDVCLLNF